MIKLIKDNYDDIYDFCLNDLYSVRIKSLLLAYGTKYDFAAFYCQYINNEITAIISKLDGDYTISALDNSDVSEIEEFLSALGFSSVLCDSKLHFNFDFTEGIVMSGLKKPEIFSQSAVINEYPRLMDLFNFADYDKSDFESWYVDISHRIRHGCAKAYTLCINDEIISSAVYSSIYNNDAVLSAVKTEPSYRRMGYASSLISYMHCDIKGTVFLMRDVNRNEDFYKKLGFENSGKWRLYK
ncbi:MAG: GNAT family N-acetyltransferase [Eubacterium sp.]|nr:GNAT family N-acetyltransferase [Eubacterium sp.]